MHSLLWLPVLILPPYSTHGQKLIASFQSAKLFSQLATEATTKSPPESTLAGDKKVNDKALIRCAAASLILLLLLLVFQLWQKSDENSFSLLFTGEET